MLRTLLKVVSTIEKFLGSEVSQNLDQAACSPELESARLFCKSTPLTVEEEYSLLAAGNLRTFTPVFSDQSPDALKLAAIEAIRVNNLVSNFDSEYPEKSALLLWLYSFLFFEVLMDVTENNPELSELKSVFGYQRELRQIYLSRPPSSSSEILRHIQCVIQCNIDGISIDQIVNSSPFNNCIQGG